MLNKSAKQIYRPLSVTIRLFANGADTGETLVLNEANGWEGTFTGLNREKDGKEIEYTVKEDAVKGYETSISGNAEDGFTVVNTHEIQPVPAKTGDNSSPRLWLGIMSLCIAVIVVALLAKRSRRPIGRHARTDRKSVV